MTTEQRYVFDTNVLVSALLFPRSTPRQAFDRANASGVLLVSVATIAELEDVLQRSAFDRYVTLDVRLEFVAAVMRDALLIEVGAPITACRDPKDDKFLDVAVCGQATHLVSGDGDLLALHPFRGIPTLSPRDFLNLPT